MAAALALPDIGLVLAGLILLALAFALYLLRNLIVIAFSHLPIIGGTVARVLASFLDDARTQVIHAADSAFHGAQVLFAAIARWCTVMWDAQVTALDDIATTVWHIATVQVPREYNAARQYAATLLAAAESTAASMLHAAQQYALHLAIITRSQAVSLFRVAERDISDGISAVQRDTALLVTRAEFDAAASLASVHRQLSSDIRSAESAASAGAAAAVATARQMFTTAERDAARALAAADATLTARISAAEQGILTDVDRIAGQALRTAWPESARDVEALRRALAGGYGDVASLLRALGGAGSAGLLGALTSALAGTAVMTRLAEECVIPNCDNLGQFGSELHSLLSDIATAAMLAWLAFAVTEPVPAADDTARVLGALVDPILGPLTDLLSAGAARL